MTADLQQGGRHACSQGRGAGLWGGRGSEGAWTGSFRWKAEASQQGWGGQNHLQTAVLAPGWAKEAAHPDSGHGQLATSRQLEPTALPLLPAHRVSLSFKRFLTANKYMLTVKLHSTHVYYKLQRKLKSLRQPAKSNDLNSTCTQRPQLVGMPACLHPACVVLWLSQTLRWALIRVTHCHPSRGRKQL